MSPQATAAQIVIDNMLGPFNTAARMAGLKWGVDRLRELVSVETATKFGSALAKLNAAIESDDPDEVAARVGVCLRGYAAMDDEAEKAGAPKSDPRLIEYEHDGFRFGILLDADYWQAAEVARPGLRLFTLAECAVALQVIAVPGVDAIKREFPRASVTAISAPSDYLNGDSIPF